MQSQATVKKVRIANKEYQVLHLNQNALGLGTWVYPGTQINVYGDDSSLGLLASVYDFVAEYKTIAYLERHSPNGADLIIIHGQSTPLNFRIAHQIKKALIKIKNGKVISLQMRPESNEDNLEHDWRFRESLSVRVEESAVLVSASKVGLRLLALECHKLTHNNMGHQHFDWWSTRRSVELIIRNKDRDD
jgi:hypothetical protein